MALRVVSDLRPPEIPRSLCEDAWSWLLALDQRAESGPELAGTLKKWRVRRGLWSWSTAWTPNIPLDFPERGSRAPGEHLNAD